MKKKKSAANARFKAAKSGVASHRSALDDWDERGGGGETGNDNIDDDDDDDRIYDVYSEDEYRKLVQARREQEDFVVDDDGLGYYDDGEEHCWDGDDDGSKKNKAGSHNHNHNHNTLTAALTSKALSKARKAAQSTHKAAAAFLLPQNQNHNHNNRSMWDFVNKGSSAGGVCGGGGGGGLTAAGAGNRKTNQASSTHAVAGPSSARLDDLLSELDDAVAYARPAHNKRPIMPTTGPLPPLSRPVRRPRYAAPPPTRSSEPRQPYGSRHDSTPPDDNDNYDNDKALQ